MVSVGMSLAVVVTVLSEGAGINISLGQTEPSFVGLALSAAGSIKMGKLKF